MNRSIRIRIISLLFTLVIFLGCTTSNIVSVKYRDDKVDLSNQAFEYLNTLDSSFVEGAWYDDDNDYMIIKLDNTYYHYCGMPDEVWDNYKKTDSFGTEYNRYIKGNYDCRSGLVPSY